jgi:hypothetical protein
MCKGNEDLPAEVNSARCISISILVFSILTLIGFIGGGIIAALGGLLGIIGAGILVCCGPGPDGGGAGKEVAAMVLFILAALFEVLGLALGLLWFFAAVSTANDTCSYGCPDSRRQLFGDSYYSYWGWDYSYWGYGWDYGWGYGWDYGWDYGTYSWGYGWDYGWDYGWGYGTYSSYSSSWCDDDTISTCVNTTVGILAILIFPTVILSAVTAILTLVGVCKANAARAALKESDGEKVTPQ